MIATIDEQGKLSDELRQQIEAARFVDAEQYVPDAAAALEGARQILMETFAEEPALTGRLREYAWTHGRLQSKLRSRLEKGKEELAEKFADYHDAIEPLGRIPSRRALAMFRGPTQK